jgi:hypothetical protein
MCRDDLSIRKLQPSRAVAAMHSREDGKTLVGAGRAEPQQSVFHSKALGISAGSVDGATPKLKAVAASFLSVLSQAQE